MLDLSPEFGRMIREMEAEFRTFRLVPKDRSRLMWITYYGLLMFLWCPDFMKTYTTVFASVVYMPRYLIGTDRGAVVLRHERVHIRDFWRTGVIPYVVSYAFIFPVGLTMRSVWEMRAYKENMLDELEKTNWISDATLNWIGKQFTGSTYLWMCPFPGLVRRWLVKIREELIAEHEFDTEWPEP